MEFCPHGARLVIGPDDVVLLDPCELCEELLLAHPKPPVPASAERTFRRRASVSTAA